MIKEIKGDTKVKLEALSRVKSFRQTVQKNFNNQVDSTSKSTENEWISKGPSALMFKLFESENKQRLQAKL